MRIILQVGDFLYTLFPNVNSEDHLVERLTEYYTYGSFKPRVTIDNGWVIIDVEVPPPH